jgi:glucuronoxylan 4-O-methyltransferase
MQLKMKTVLKNILRRLLARPSLELSSHLPLPFLITVMRRLNEIQLSNEELRIVINSVSEKTPCNFLVFGLGNDSLFWSKINRGGNTVFVEDNEGWFQEVLKQHHHITAYLVDYLTQRTHWKELLESPSLLDMKLPEEIEREKWDVILVDAPAGWKDSHPGRMKSIFISSRLANHSSDVFVHDCHRQIEKIYCDRFLKQENLKAEVGLLRHYHITNRCA